jgi:putative molybdopterin biosynthesis protein
MEQNFLTPAEVADLLKIKKNTVYEMIKRGDIRASKLGKQLRISQDDLDQYLGRKTAAHSEQVLFEQAPSISASDELIIVCGQDVVLDKLCDRLNEQVSGAQFLRSHKGSYNAMYALYNQQVHIASCHMWDAATDSYNLPFIPMILPGMDVSVFHMFNRIEGFYVRKGNPKQISSFEDFSRSDLTFVNREKGSGVRILVDEKLLSLGISPDKVNGYGRIVTSHLDAATNVSIGYADYAVGNERTSLTIPDIEFIPLQSERYDLVIPTSSLKKPAYQAVVSLLKDPAFQTEIRYMGGYDITDIGKQIL